MATIDNLRPVGQGETFRYKRTYRDPEGNAYNLTGHTLVMEIEHKGELVGSYPATLGTGVANISIEIEDEETATWPEGNLKYVTVHSSPDGTVNYLTKGTFTVFRKWA